MHIIWNLNPKQVRHRLVVLTLCISFISLITEYFADFILPPSDNGLGIHFLNLFSVNLEGSFPTWYSTLLLFISGVLLVWISRIKFQEQDHQRWYWLGLVAGFFYLSADEGAGIHEIFVDVTKETFNTSGFFEFGWQIVAIPVVLVVMLLYVRFVHRLPTQTRFWLVVSAFVYLGGALIVEGISANQWSMDGGMSMRYLSIATIEETMEMLGAVFFIYTWLDYIVLQGYTLSTTSEATPRKSHGRHLIQRILPLLILLNISVVGWMMWGVSHTVISDDDIVVIEVPFYYAIQEQILADGGVIVEVPGTFGIDNAFSRQIGRTLFEEYSTVIAISQPTRGITTLFATYDPMIERIQWTELLHDAGQTNFILFDSDTVRSISNIP